MASVDIWMSAPPNVIVFGILFKYHFMSICYNAEPDKL